MRLLLSVLATLLLTIAAHAQAPRIDRIDIFEKGVFQNERTQSRPDPKSPTGTHDTVTNIRLVENTTTVRARHGVDVGIRFTVVGAPQGAVVPLSARRNMVAADPDGFSSRRHGRLIGRRVETACRC